jgi:DNA-binding transcriptional regulator YhcF (GntR family)
MQRKAVRTLFIVNPHSVTPKHRQIIEGVKNAIIDGRLRRNDIIPTISEVCETYGISRLTVLRAYEELQRAGIIRAEKRKGYYVTSEDVRRTNNIFLLFDEFNMYKRVLYNAFWERIGPLGTIDLFFHHYSTKQFDSLILNNIGTYTFYAIMPWPEKNILPALSKLDRKLTLLLDRGDALPKSPEFNSIIQDHKDDMAGCLEKALPSIKRYHKFILVHPSYSYHPVTTIDGFISFCTRHGITHDIYRTFDHSKILPDTAYFCVDDNELVTIVEHCRDSGYELGRDIGLMSYNETPMKKIIANGITVISTDFAMMGVRAADHILNPVTHARETIPTLLIMRKSL